MPEDPVGFIGLGNMGGRMSRCLLQKGRSVIGFDARPETAAASGVEPAESIGAVVAKTDLILLSLPDSRVVEAVVLGPDGILAHARPGLAVVDLSTASPVSTRMIHDRLAKAGVTFLDAGISGGAAGAETGTLTLMVGGDERHLDAVRDVLSCFAINIFHLGETGAGHTAKVLNNFLNAVTLAATAEVMVAGKKAGLDLGVLLDVLNTSSGASYATAKRFPKIIHGDYMKGGLSNTLMMKDVTLYSQLVGQLGMTSLNATGPTASFGLAIALGYADEISNKVVDAIGDISGGVRLHSENGETKTK
jgi:3-hydroxyisobutyrate dehydrogenase-like beta-hydroxyacid dehydrogenase